MLVLAHVRRRRAFGGDDRGVVGGVNPPVVVLAVVVGAAVSTGELGSRTTVSAACGSTSEHDPPDPDNQELQTRTFSITAAKCVPVTMETVDNPGELGKDLVETEML